jgi:hypothetical protein
MALQPQQKQQLMSHGVTDQQTAAAEQILTHPQAAALGLDWNRIIQLVQQWGPMVLQIIMSILGVTPTPAPGTAQTPQAAPGRPSPP